MGMITDRLRELAIELIKVGRLDIRYTNNDIFIYSYYCIGGSCEVMLMEESGKLKISLFDSGSMDGGNIKVSKNKESGKYFIRDSMVIKDYISGDMEFHLEVVKEVLNAFNGDGYKLNYYV